MSYTDYTLNYKYYQWVDEAFYRNIKRSKVPRWDTHMVTFLLG